MLDDLIKFGPSPEPEPEPLPENWQAIACMVANRLNVIVDSLNLMAACIRAAIHQDNYQAFQTELKNLEEWANDKPE